MLLLLLLALFYSSLFSPSSSFLCLASPTQAPAIDLLVIIPTRALDVGLAQILCSTSCALSPLPSLCFSTWRALFRSSWRKLGWVGAKDICHLCQKLRLGPCGKLGEMLGRLNMACVFILLESFGRLVRREKRRSILVLLPSTRCSRGWMLTQIGFQASPVSRALALLLSSHPPTNQSLPGAPWR